MPRTIINTAVANGRFTHAAPIVEIKATWGATDWEPAPTLMVRHLASGTAGADMGRCELLRPYGLKKEPWQRADQMTGGTDESKPFPTVLPINLNRYWVRVSLLAPTGRVVCFVGQILSETKDFFGGGLLPPNGPPVAKTGAQMWTAFGPAGYLERIEITESVWLVRYNERGEAGPDTDEETKVNSFLSWVPDVNNHDEARTIVGNRSDLRGLDEEGEEDEAKAYVYGGTELWNHFEHCKYLLEHFINVAGGPVFTLGGDVAILRGMTDTLGLGDGGEGPSVRSAFEHLKALISPDYGIDFLLKYRAASGSVGEGFEIVVHALLPEEIRFEGATLPANKDHVRLNLSRDVGAIECRIETSTEEMVRTIEVAGRRVIACCSLRGYTDAEIEETPALRRTAEFKWTDELEEDYRAATDAERATDKFSDVYQKFGAPLLWDHQDGKAAPIGVLVRDLDGQLLTSKAAMQNSVRSTLTWLPLVKGIDYGDVARPSTSPTGDLPELLPPMALLYDDLRETTDGESQPGYVHAEKAGVHVHALQKEWGLHLQAQPNHLLGLTRFANLGDGPPAPTETDPVFDPYKIILTIAFEANSRLSLGYLVDEAPDDGSRKVISTRAECWYIAPKTVVGINTDGTPRLLPSAYDTTGLVLRSDQTRMYPILCGAIARHGRPRVRATIKLRGWRALPNLLGQILSIVDEGGEESKVGSVITRVAWEGGQDHPITVIEANYAQTAKVGE